MSASIAQDLYNRLLYENNEAFDAGLFNVSYHILAAALHCAEKIDADGPLQKISLIAEQQLKWIDRNHPEYEHSSASAYKRGRTKSIFALLSSQAEMILMMQKVKSAEDEVKDGHRGE